MCETDGFVCPWMSRMCGFHTSACLCPTRFPDFAVFCVRAPQFTVHGLYESLKFCDSAVHGLHAKRLPAHVRERRVGAVPLRIDALERFDLRQIVEHDVRLI